MFSLLIEKNELERFYSKIKKQDCWIWVGGKTEGNWTYGRFYLKRKPYLAHRVSYFIHNGSFPKKKFVCHKCDNPSCVNPDHLFLGDAKTNAVDCKNKGRNLLGRESLLLGTKHPKAKLTDCTVKEIREIGSSISTRKLARKFGVSQTKIRQVLSGECWKHI